MEADSSLIVEVDRDLAKLLESRRQAERDQAFISSTSRHLLEEIHTRALSALLTSSDGRPLVDLLVRIADVRRSMDVYDARQRRTTDAAIGCALAQLRELKSSNEISRKAPTELREACGFTRVMISSARGSRWIPDTMRTEDHADPDSAEYERFSQDDNEIPLARMMPETAMMRHRVPVIVQDAEADSRTYKPLVRVTRSRSYVAAPIVTTRRVIGFLHADRIGQHSDITDNDLDSISIFASEFGVIFELVVLAERAEKQRVHVASALRDTIVGLEDLGQSTLGAEASNLVPHKIVDVPFGNRPLLARGSVLTEREREVMSLVSTGATNRLIAHELVLSEDTVKTHIKNILRKLHSTSRAEAVARYLQLQQA
ncbi:LuxR C-terminal-related transcriptional regulator [Rhodococcus globerulus]|jgi:DNA-binding CsgD family transcriptional regulator|uniref:LuxR C-terminal-related transcriptional regulator n=1 Tax=Rhodococcus globerulus TaxID=33008 RepID=UPI001F44B45A|nr:LuxR C-terminal-related transcriptional regulator [Rhodococcus globerulus]MCE4267272.1 GAF domain-containing protein [Rhodococcus globerulus]